MKISESNIDEIIEAIEKNPDHQEKFKSEQTPFIHFLNNSVCTQLKSQEIELLYFCLLVIYHSAIKAGITADFDLDEFLIKDEANWSIRDKKQSFSKAKDLYFNDYPEEDLLAFVEDMLTENEEQQVQLPGEEIVFVSCKSYIDYLFSI